MALYHRSILVFMMILGLQLPFWDQATSVAFGQNQEARQIEFRIDTDIYSDESKPPIQSTKTMFLATKTIEWDDTHRRLLLVDYLDRSITLADLPAQRKYRLGMSELSERLSSLQAQMTAQENGVWISSTPPRWIDGGFFELGCERSMYRFKTAPPKVQAMAIQYADFADWSVKMHAVNPPYKPPLLRIQLNAYLRAQGELPTEIRLTDLRSDRSRPVSSKPVIARLIVQDQLTGQDSDRIGDWEVLASTLKTVSEVEYFQQANSGPTNKLLRR
jgi:hypothetical protein